MENISLIVMKLITFLSLFYFSLNNCNNRALPIFLPLDNQCVMKYCQKEEFINNTCVKDNNIIKTQWLNNIIKFGVENCRYSKIAKFSTGEMIVISNNKSPYFYGLNKDGRFFFTKDGKESPYNSLNYVQINNNFCSQKQNYQNYNHDYDNGEIVVVKMEDNGKEYILNIGICIDLYDFESNYIFNWQTNNIINSKMIISVRYSIFNLKDSSNFMFSGIFSENYYQNININLYLNKIKLEKKDGTFSIIKSEKFGAIGYMVSCFQVGKKYIICFYILQSKDLKISVFDEELNSVGDGFTIQTNTINNVNTRNIFFKAIHFGGEDGFFFILII